MIKRTNWQGLISVWPELNISKEWGYLIPKKNADYYIYFEDEKPLAFQAIIDDGKTVHVHAMKKNPKYDSNYAVFILTDWICRHFADKPMKINACINPIALFLWKKAGFTVTKEKTCKCFTSWTLEREAIL